MTTNEMTQQYEEWDIEVAKRIACAVTAYQASVPFQSLWEDMQQSEEPVGTFWLAIAKQIREEMPNKSK